MKGRRKSILFWGAALLHRFGFTKNVVFSLGFVLANCDHGSQSNRELTHRGYIWQRDWTPAVVDTLKTARQEMAGVVLLGAEIVWENETAKVIPASIDRKAVREQGASTGVALRVAPALRTDDKNVQLVITVARTLCDEAKANGVTLSEFQLDFDCPQKELASYRSWLPKVRDAVRPAPFVITTLPAWLDESEFVRLINQTDGYVLQVHSVPITSQNPRALLCDTVLARRWIARADRLGIPFSVALPTYRCSAGYSPSGKLISVSMDSVGYSWPPDTRVLEFESDADAIALLVNQLKTKTPPKLRDIFWYRLPVASDSRNWRWPTLRAVQEGRAPRHQLEAVQDGDNPVDIAITNRGEADESLNHSVTVSWDGPAPVSADALNGWTVSPGAGRAVFRSSRDFRLRLAPGATLKIGWLRLIEPTSLRLQLAGQQHDASR